MPECFAREARRKFFLFLKKVESYLIKVHRGKIFRGVINLKSRGGGHKEIHEGGHKKFLHAGGTPPDPPRLPMYDTSCLFHHCYRYNEHIVHYNDRHSMFSILQRIGEHIQV